MNRLLTAALGTAAVGAALTAVPAQATTAPAAAVTCTASAQQAPFYRRDADATVSAARAAQLQHVLDATRSSGADRALPSTIVVPIRAHVIRSSHRRDKHTTRAQVIRQVEQPNHAYDGMEAPGIAPDTHIRFRLRSITSTVNDRWYRISGPGKAANQMKRALHQGRSFTLNLYFVDLASRGLLGYTTFPWRYHLAPKLDGVVVAYNTVPGGTLRPYNQGDTAVHEIGHWLGLLHTFQGGCGGTGDGVADTPAEAAPQYRCDTTADTCPSPGLDPVHNFMDYSLDSCMYEFTPGQAARMFTAWEKYRLRH